MVLFYYYFLGHSNNIDEGRSGGGLDTSPMHPSLYHHGGGNRGSNNAANNNNSPTPSGQQMLVVPQPVKSSNLSTSVPNGTGRKYQCKMCPQVRRGRKNHASMNCARKDNSHQCYFVYL